MLSDLVSDEQTPFHNPFGSLGHLRGPLPPEPATPEPSPARKGIARAVVRIERTGRSGKAVTVVEHLGLDAKTRDEWLMALKAALGCGGTQNGDALVLQGDQRDRLPALLKSRGVKKVTAG